MRIKKDQSQDWDVLKSLFSYAKPYYLHHSTTEQT